MPPVVLHGDCLEHLRTLPDASVHAICTDPPYGLADHKPATLEATLLAWLTGDRASVPDGKGFMGRTWDAFVPPPAVWDECLRVLKPGGHMLVFAGSRTVDLMGLSIRLAGFELRDEVLGLGLAWVQGQGFPKDKNQLKPAHEPILVARKPLQGAVAANVLAHGTGGLNIDATRVPGKWTTWTRKDGSINPSAGFANDYVGGNARPENVRNPEHPAGRWPPNVVLVHSPDCDGQCAPGCPVAELDQQSGISSKPSKGVRGRGSEIYANGKGFANTLAEVGQEVGYGDTGGASRFFPTFRYQAKAPARERPKVNGVAHVSVKPLELMRWLVRLCVPPGGTVLDPFAGSGTTIEAAILEGFDVIGIEREADYLPLIQQRIDRATQQQPKAQPAGLFDLESA